MASYAYHCEGGHAFITVVHGLNTCPCGSPVSRDYRREGVGFTGLAEMKRQREQGLDGLSGRSAQRDIFLPTAEDMRKPGDPTGQKGLHEWNEKHEPRPTNKAPLRPETDKRVW